MGLPAKAGNRMFEFLQNLLRGLQAVLFLDPRAFAFIQNSPDSGRLIAVIAVFGGASLLIGQSVILFVNRVRPARFLLSLLVNGLVFYIGLVIWAIAIWLTGRILFTTGAPLSTVIRMVGLGAAPYLFGFLVLIPYMGDFIGRVLSVWSFLIVLAALNTVAGGAFWAVLLCTGLGWLLITVMSLTLGKPIVALRNRLFRAAAGTDLDASVADILVNYATEERSDSQQQGGRS
jgi:hypothetical protein